MSVYRLDDASFDFPSAEEADDEYDGLLAVGGDYNPERLLNAYSNGIFPWPVAEGRPITWFSPDPRFVLKAADFRIPKSLKKTLKKRLLIIASIRHSRKLFMSVPLCRAQGRMARGLQMILRRGIASLTALGLRIRSRPGRMKSLSAGFTALR